MQVRWIAIGLALGCTQGHALAGGAAAAPCIAADAEPVLIAIDGGKLRQCAGDAAHLSCVAIDLASGAWGTAPAPAGSDRSRVVPPAGAPKVTVADNRATVCHADGTACKTLVPKGEVDPGLGLSAAANDAGTLAALGYYGDTVWVETFDLATGKRLGRVKAGSKKAKCVSVDVLGDAIAVTESVCGSAPSGGWIGTRTGKKVAPVGGKDPIAPSGRAVQLADKQWAFASATGDAVVVQDVASGKVVKRIAIGPADDNASTALVGDGKRLVLVFGGSRAGDIAVIDPATDKVTPYPGKRCGK